MMRSAPVYIFFFSSRRRHTRFDCDWRDVCSSDLNWACATCYNGRNQYNSTLAPSISYDSDGHLLNDTFYQYTWDVYGHPSTIGPATGTITCGTSGTYLTYDANGNMVEKNVSGVYTEILYSPIGKT